MIELDGVEYPIRNPDENAQDLVAYINNYCEENDIRNNQGDLIYIDANETNPLYMMCYGMAYLMTDLQKLTYSAGSSMSINDSSERQLLNLADIADVHRKDATKTTIMVTIYADESTDLAEDDPDYVEPHSCKITKWSEDYTDGCKVTISYGNQSLVFVPSFETTIPVGGCISMMLICQQEGSFSISEGVITSFDINPEGFRKMTSMASIPGQGQETIAALRQRIQYRDTSYTQIDAAILAIEDLDGVSSCSIYYNYNTQTTTMVSGINVPPRMALITVQGYSDDIAKAFYQHLMCNCAGEDYYLEYNKENEDDPEPKHFGEECRCQKQIYTTLAGQELPVYIFTPVLVNIHIKVYLLGTYTSAEQSDIKDTICLLSRNLAVGDTVTAADIINIIRDNFSSFNVQGAVVGTNGEDWDYKATPGSSELYIFNTDYIDLIIEAANVIEEYN